jgi:hypothetical protein
MRLRTSALDATSAATPNYCDCGVTVQGRQYDVVVLDPPKLAPSRASLERATTKVRMYGSLHIFTAAPGSAVQAWVA